MYVPSQLRWNVAKIVHSNTADPATKKPTIKIKSEQEHVPAEQGYVIPKRCRIEKFGWFLLRKYQDKHFHETKIRAASQMDGLFRRGVQERFWTANSASKIIQSSPRNQNEGSFKYFFHSHPTINTFFAPLNLGFVAKEIVLQIGCIIWGLDASA